MPADFASRFDAGRTITFYSYKGGTGRTMSLANVAVLLAQQESTDSRGVLMIDWDLEAPGLHRFFRHQLKSVTTGTSEPDQKIDHEKGLIDFFWRLKGATHEFDPKHPQKQAQAKELLDYIPPESFILKTDFPGNLSLLKAGRMDDEYSKKVNTFGWEDFHNRAPWLIRSFGERLAKQYRYVLIDSRTGLTDVSGICTMLLPETLVFVFTPNRQSIQGGLSLIKRATDYRLNSSDLRPLVVFPLASRVEPARERLREDWRKGNAEKGIKGFQPQFEKLFASIYQLKHCDLQDYFDEIQIQHTPDYAYGESIAAEVEGADDRLSLKRSYKTFVDRLLNSPSPWQKEPLTVEARAGSSLQTIVFANGNTAQVVQSTSETGVSEAVRSLNLDNVSALLIIVGATFDENSHITEMLSHPLSRFIVETNTSVLDAGIDRGISKVIGDAVTHRTRTKNLIGVAPADLVTYPPKEATTKAEEDAVPLDPNHTHFLLSQGTNWGDEVDTKYELASELGKYVPVVSIFAGHSSSSSKELLQIVKQHWPIMVIEGSCALADQIAAIVRSRESNSEDAAKLITDPTLDEVVSEGDILIFPKDGNRQEFEQLCYRLLPTGRTLESAWQTYIAFARKALSLQLKSSAIRFGFVTLLAVGGLLLMLPYILNNAGVLAQPDVQRILSYGVMLGMAMLLQFHFLKFDQRKNELRSIAENIKSEIFKYRCRIGEYATPGAASSAALLTTIDKLRNKTHWTESITETKVVRPLRGTSSDDNFSLLTPEQYLESRLDNQLAYHRSKGKRWSAQTRWLTILLPVVFVCGAGASLFLGTGAKTAAIFPATVILALVLIGIRGAADVNQSGEVSAIVAKQLNAMRLWWTFLSPEERDDPESFASLVTQTEKVIKSSWAVPGVDFSNDFEPAKGVEQKVWTA